MGNGYYDGFSSGAVLGMIVGIVITTALITLFINPVGQHVAARAVCDSHNLDLDSYEFVDNSVGFKFVKCKPRAVSPEPFVFENVGKAMK